MKKQAYSLAEMIIVIAIISFIILLMFKTIKPSYKTIPIAYNRVFTSLEDAVYNAYQKILDENTIFPGGEEKPNPYKSAQELCTLIATNPKVTDDKGYINTIVYNCGKSFKTVPAKITRNVFSDDNMAFQAANSMKFYISPLQSVKIKNAVSKNQIINVRYFIVWVDINGERNPNTAFTNKKGIVDIVPFIVTTRGDVLPTGYPTTDMRYLSAYVQYPLNTTPLSSQSMTYFDAQTSAYGGKEYPYFDALSIRDSILNQHTGTAMEITSYNPQSITYDQACKPEKASDEPLCKIEINSRL